MPERSHYYLDQQILDNTGEDYEGGEANEPIRVDHYKAITGEDIEPNLVGSLVDVSPEGDPCGQPMHLPVIDIDLPCRLVPSSTEGHFHLYIDHLITPDQYDHLLCTLVEVGLVQQGVLNRFHNSSQTFVRLPHVKKPDPGLI